MSDPNGRANLTPMDAEHRACADSLRKRGRATCAYCGSSLVDGPYRWLLACADYIISPAQLARLGLDESLARSPANHVIICTECRSLAQDCLISHDRQPRTMSREAFEELCKKALVTRRRIIAKLKTRKLRTAPAQADLTDLQKAA